MVDTPGMCKVASIPQMVDFFNYYGEINFLYCHYETIRRVQLSEGCGSGGGGSSGGSNNIDSTTPGSSSSPSSTQQTQTQVLHRPIGLNLVIDFNGTNVFSTPHKFRQSMLASSQIATRVWLHEPLFVDN